VADADVEWDHGAADAPPFPTLARDVVACRRCRRLVEFREQVARERRRAFRDQEYWGRPLPPFGDPRARLLVVGLAPAAHGGNRTGRYFTGDGSGDWLIRAMHRAGFASQPTSRQRGDGLYLIDAYLTAVARCVPPDNRPSPAELATCRPWLLRELALLAELRVVVALGRVAFDGFLAALRGAGLQPGRPVFGHGADHRLPNGLVLLASYHPSRQNTQTGKLTESMLDAVFARARDVLGAPSR
jgi:uracil-DNA glycosylase family 4